MADAKPTPAEKLAEAMLAPVAFIATAHGTTRGGGYAREGTADQSVPAGEFTDTWMKPKSPADAAKLKALQKARDAVEETNA